MSRISNLNLITDNMPEYKGLYIVEPVSDLFFLTEDNIDEYVDALYKKEQKSSIILKKRKRGPNMRFSYNKHQALCIA